jgi:hypothetical protein
MVRVLRFGGLVVAALAMVGCRSEIRTVSVHNGLSFPISLKVDRYKFGSSIAPGATTAFPDKIYRGESVAVQAFRIDNGKRVFKQSFSGSSLKQIDNGERIAIDIK